MRALIANNSIASFVVEATAELFGSRRRIAILTLIALMTGLIGPFGTDTGLFSPARYLYWALIVFGTVWPVQLVFTAFERQAKRAHRRQAVWVPAASFVAAVPVTVVVVAVALAFGSGNAIAGIAGLYMQCALVIMAVATVVHLLEQPAALPAARHNEPPILRRLPGAKRGKLLRLTAQDHYVEVVTDRGATLVPMRFKDAIFEVGKLSGSQVHRSHWVATDAIVERRHRDGRMQVRMTDGAWVPVGRTYRDQARTAGVLL